MGVVTFALHYEMGTLALACFDRNVYKPIVSSFQFTHPSSTLSKAPRRWLCEGNSSVTGESPLTETGEFLSQKASNAENVSIWRRHHDRKQPLPSHTKHNKARFVCVILEMCYIHGALSQKLRGVFTIDFPTHTHTSTKWGVKYRWQQHLKYVCSLALSHAVFLGMGSVWIECVRFKVHFMQWPFPI